MRPEPSMKSELVFLTRDSCVNTPEMVNNLHDAPTVLWKGVDIDGMPAPIPPFLDPA